MSYRIIGRLRHHTVHLSTFESAVSSAEKLAKHLHLNTLRGKQTTEENRHDFDTRTTALEKKMKEGM